MELIKYDENEDVATINITGDELHDFALILIALSATFSSQDRTIFAGIDEERLDELHGLIVAMMPKHRK